MLFKLLLQGTSDYFFFNFLQNSELKYFRGHFAFYRASFVVIPSPLVTLWLSDTTGGGSRYTSGIYIYIYIGKGVNNKTILTILFTIRVGILKFKFYKKFYTFSNNEEIIVFFFNHSV